jgi:hypothetical protein
MSQPHIGIPYQIWQLRLQSNQLWWYHSVTACRLVPGGFPASTPTLRIHNLVLQQPMMGPWESTHRIHTLFCQQSAAAAGLAWLPLSWLHSGRRIGATSTVAHLDAI